MMTPLSSSIAIPGLQDVGLLNVAALEAGLGPVAKPWEEVGTAPSFEVETDVEFVPDYTDETVLGAAEQLFTEVDRIVGIVAQRMQNPTYVTSPSIQEMNEWMKGRADWLKGVQMYLGEKNPAFRSLLGHYASSYGQPMTVVRGGLELLDMRGYPDGPRASALAPIARNVAAADTPKVIELMTGRSAQTTHARMELAEWISFPLIEAAIDTEWDGARLQLRLPMERLLGLTQNPMRRGIFSEILDPFDPVDRALHSVQMILGWKIAFSQMGPNSVVTFDFDDQSFHSITSG